MTTSNTNFEVIDLMEEEEEESADGDDDIDDDIVVVAVTAAPSQKLVHDGKRNATLSGDGVGSAGEGAGICRKRVKASSHDEIETVNIDRAGGGNDMAFVMAAPAAVVSPVKKAGRDVAGSGDDDIRVIGTVNSVALPHMRCHCTTHPFSRVICLENTQGSSANRKACELCFCYVCDRPVKECAKWDEHCDATDKSEYWRNERESVRRKPFEAIIEDGRVLKHFLDCIRGLTKSAVIMCDPEGIRLGEMSAHHVILAEWHLSCRAFSLYRCTKSMKIGIPLLQSLHQGMKHIKQKHGPLSMEADVNKLFMSCKEASQEFNAIEIDLDSDVKSMAIGSYAVCAQYSATIKLPSTQLKQILQTFKSFGSGKGSVIISCTKEGVRFSHRNVDCNPGSVLHSSFFFKARANTASGKEILVTCEEPISVEIAMRHSLDCVSKVNAFTFPCVEIRIGKDSLASFDYSFYDGNGSIRYYCALKD